MILSDHLILLADVAEQTSTLNTTVLAGLIIAIAVLAVTQSRRENKRIEREEMIRAQEKKEDWARQDKVAQRAEAAAERVAEVAETAALTAQLLKERQDAAAEAAAQAATDLIKANNRLARETARAAAIVNGKLDQIHTLVNSNLSEAMRDRLTAIQALIVALKAAPDQSHEARQRIAQLESTAVELEVQLNDRLRQTKIAEAQLTQGEEGSVTAEWIDED